MSVTATLVEQRLNEHGYALVRRTADHGVFEHQGDRLVVPQHSAELSPWTIRTIEQTLEPRLGPRWLTDAGPTGGQAGTGRVDPPRQLLLHLVIRPEPDRRTWNAFVAEEPRILTFAPTLRGVRERARDAACAWFADRAQVDLVPVVQLDAAARRWIDGAEPATCDEARHRLRALGFLDEDIDELLGG